MINLRISYVFFIIFTVLLGLASRKFSAPDGWVHLYAGDALWAMLFYFIFRFIFIHKSLYFNLILTLSWCFIIEISQLYHAAWIDAIRQTTLGGLILGFGFLWTDLFCYIAGAALGFAFDKIWFKQTLTTFN